MSLGRTKGGNPKVSMFFSICCACELCQRSYIDLWLCREGVHPPSLECHMKHLNHRVSGRMNRHIKTLLLLLYISMEIGNDFDIVS